MDRMPSPGWYFLGSAVGVGADVDAEVDLSAIEFSIWFLSEVIAVNCVRLNVVPSSYVTKPVGSIQSKNVHDVCSDSTVSDQSESR